MGDLKPIGSEKLQGDDKIKRILELTYYKQNTIKENTRSVHAELIKETVNGVYGIVKEKDGYYVKRGLNEGTLDYIGGMFMKNKNRFSSYAEALKRLELINSQELNEDVTKYVLKQNKPKSEEPLPVPAMPEELPAPAPEMGGDSTEMPAPEMDDATSDMGEPSVDDMSAGQSETSKRSDYMAEIQKFAGKLGQELRDQQPKMESDDIKYVLNMIISAVDLDTLDEEDIDDIAKKFDRDEESMGEPEMNEPTPEDDMDVPSEDEVPAEPEDDLAERISKLEELINTKFETNEQDLDEYQDVEEHFFYDDEDFERRDSGLEPLSRRPDGTKIRPEDEEQSNEYELDITPELDDINESINTTLSKYFE